MKTESRARDGSLRPRESGGIAIARLGRHISIEVERRRFLELLYIGAIDVSLGRTSWARAESSLASRNVVV